MLHLLGPASPPCCQKLWPCAMHHGCQQGNSRRPLRRIHRPTTTHGAPAHPPTHEPHPCTPTSGISQNLQRPLKCVLMPAPDSHASTHGLLKCSAAPATLTPACSCPYVPAMPMRVCADHRGTSPPACPRTGCSLWTVMSTCISGSRCWRACPSSPSTPGALRTPPALRTRPASVPSFLPAMLGHYRLEHGVTKWSMRPVSA